MTTKRDRTGWRYVATKDGQSMRLEHETWSAALDHVQYLHQAYRGHGHLFGITRFYRKRNR